MNHRGPFPDRGLVPWVAVLVAFVVGGCRFQEEAPHADMARLQDEIRVRFPAVKTVSTEELAGWMARPAEVRPLLLDVRAPEEFAVSHLPGAVSSPDVAQTGELLRSRTNPGPVVLYCSVGYRSADMADALQAQGHTNLFNLPVYGLAAAPGNSQRPFSSAPSAALNLALRF